MQIDVAAIVHRFSDDLFCSRVVFSLFRARSSSIVLAYCFEIVALVWLAAVLDGGGRALLRVLYRDSRDAGCSYDVTRAFL